MNNNGTLYLFPMTLGDSSISSVIPKEVQQIIINTKYFIVENIRTTRRYLKKIDPNINIDKLTFFTLNKHTKPEEIHSYLNPIKEGNNIGIISEAGCPGIADPGSNVVALAHSQNIPVKPLVGPSSILLALIASGFNGQQFIFHGYLPKDKNQLKKKLIEIDKEASKGITQIFMETPFRNNQIVDDILTNCNPLSKLTIACDITLPTEFIQTKNLKNWKKNKPDINKRPAIFVMG